MVDAQQRSLRLYRQILRSVPQILSDYKLHNVLLSPSIHIVTESSPVQVSPAVVRDRVRTEFLASQRVNGNSVDRIDLSIFRYPHAVSEQ